MADVSLDDLGVHHQALRHVLQRAQDDVGRQERLGQRDPPVESGGGEEELQEEVFSSNCLLNRKGQRCGAHRQTA